MSKKVGHVVDIKYVGVFDGDSSCDHTYPEGTMWSDAKTDTFGWPCSDCGAQLKFEKVRAKGAPEKDCDD